MIISIKNGYEIYDINVDSITQLCGKNMLKKSFIVESLYKYFSTSKYLQHEEVMENNIFLEGNMPGRNYFSLHRIRDRRDLIENLKLKKTGLMHDFINEKLDEFEYQKNLFDIHVILEKMFRNLNENLSWEFDGLRLNFSEKDIFEMVQHCFICCNEEEKEIEYMSNYRLLLNYIYLIARTLQYHGEKTMVILENIDHMLSEQDYVNFMKELSEIIKKCDLWLIVTTSIDGYCYIEQEVFTSINCVNNIIYNMPEYHDLKEYIECNYPVNICFDGNEFDEIIRSAVHNIGIQEKDNNIRSMIIEHIINDSECVLNGKRFKISKPEINFLCK